MNMSNFLQEDSGKFSATRLALLVWVLGLLAVWAAGSIHQIYLGGTAAGLLDLPTSTITLVGILMAGKVVQKYEEQPGAQPAEDATARAVEKK